MRRGEALYHNEPGARSGAFRGLRVSAVRRSIRRPSGKSQRGEAMCNDDVPTKARLLQATDALAQELLFIRSSLATYCVIGLNSSKIESGKLIFGHLQRLSLLSVALGLAKV